MPAHGRQQRSQKAARVTGLVKQAGIPHVLDHGAELPTKNYRTECSGATERNGHGRPKYAAAQQGCDRRSIAGPQVEHLSDSVPGILILDIVFVGSSKSKSPVTRGDRALV